MRNIINSIKAAFNLSSAKEKVVECNYANNYYGDQYCQTEAK